MGFLNKEKINFITNTILRDISTKSNQVLCKPTFVSIALSEQCCLRCRQCDIWKNTKIRNQLSFSERKKAIMRLKKWLGNFKLNFTGGEPFLNKQTIPLITYASSLGISTFINSNGYLIDKRMSKRIFNSGLSHLSISLDSVNSQIHDYIRGVKGSYDRALQAIKQTRKFKDNNKKLLISITSIILKQNLKDLKRLVYLVGQLKLDGINFQPLMSKYSFGKLKYNPLWYKREPLWPKDLRLMEKTINNLIKLKKQGYPIYNPIWELNNFITYFKDPNSFNDKPCLVGLSNFSINVKGDVRLCFTMNPVGNINNQKPEIIWLSKLAKLQRERIKKCQKNCRILLCNRKYNLAEVVLEFLYRKLRLL